MKIGEAFRSADMRKKIARSIMIGFVGGAIAEWLHLPLAWMIGSMIATFSVAMARIIELDYPMSLRMPLLIILGPYIGSSFQPELLIQMQQWPITMAAIVLYVPLIVVVIGAYYYFVARTDLPTAVFASCPGGMSAMIVMGGSVGGNEPQIALAQGLRVMILVLLAPIIFILLTGEIPETHISGSYELIGWGDFFLLAVSVLASVWLLKRWKIPSAEMVGSMLITAVFYVSGLVEGALPEWALSMTLCLLGSSIGARFIHVDRAFFLRFSGHVVVAVLLVLALTAGFSYVLAHLLDYDILAVLLAFAPGGVAEMSLIAIVMNIAPAFVAFHHLVRLFALLFFTPILAKWMQSHQIHTKT